MSGEGAASSKGAAVAPAAMPPLQEVARDVTRGLQPANWKEDSWTPENTFKSTVSYWAGGFCLYGAGVIFHSGLGSQNSF